MPINTQEILKRIPEDEFKNLDYEIMGQAYKTHNDLGRFFEEKIYTALLCEFLREAGLQHTREFQLRIEHKTFRKAYYIDLLIEGSIPYELKAVHSLNPAHDAQLLHYLLLADLAHGKLVNFRETSVHARYLSTSLIRADRLKHKLHTENWREEPGTPEIAPILAELLKDWGTHLSIELYKEALCHFLGIGTHSLSQLELSHNGTRLGIAELPMLNPHTILHITAIQHASKEHEAYIRRLLHLSQARKAQWINLGHRIITLTTITDPRLHP
ncbi:MAG: GxxExxY protein [Coraliomargarita sp.]